MKIDLTKTFTGFNGEKVGAVESYAVAVKTDSGYEPVVLNGKQAYTDIPGEVLTLKKFLEQALFAEIKDEKGEDKLTRSKLGLKILNCSTKTIDLTAEEIVLAKKVALDKSHVLITAQVDKYLEGK